MNICMFTSAKSIGYQSKSNIKNSLLKRDLPFLVTFTKTRYSMDIIFATNNHHKIVEIGKLLDRKYIIKSLSEAGIFEDIPENEETLEGNAIAKSRYVYQRTGKNVFADDTGLEVAALGNLPGVHSARYAGSSRDPGENIDKLLREMKDIDNRAARFRTVIALIFNGEEYLFEGIVNGVILRERRGSGGFGYDPLFVADGMTRSFAEISLDQKNSVSHRAIATVKLAGFLDQYFKQ